MIQRLLRIPTTLRSKVHSNRNCRVCLGACAAPFLLQPDETMDEERAYRIRLRAYQLWKQAGEPLGKHLDFWLVAETEDAAASKDDELKEGLEESLPASDTPSSLRR